MRKLLVNLIAIFLMLTGGSLLVMGMMDGQGLLMMAGAGLAFLAGVAALLLLAGRLGNRAGKMLGVAFAMSALLLAYLNHRELRAARAGRTAPGPITAPTSHGR